MIVLPYPVGRTTTRSLFIYCFQTFRVLRIQEPPPTTLAHRNWFWLYSHIQLSSDECSCVAAWFVEQIVGLMFSSSTVVVNIKASNSRLLFLNLFWLYHLSTAFALRRFRLRRYRRKYWSSWKKHHRLKLWLNIYVHAKILCSQTFPPKWHTKPIIQNSCVATPYETRQSTNSSLINVLNKDRISQVLISAGFLVI